MYTRKCFVKAMLEDQDDLSTDALTLHPRLLREGLGDKAQPLTRPPWNQVAIRRCTGVGLGACRTGDQQVHHGHGAGKNECVAHSPRHGRAKEQG